ncbi:MAG: lysylphosphatidylglycerol synthase domain-containing protein [Ruegeria sp.]
MTDGEKREIAPWRGWLIAGIVTTVCLILGMNMLDLSQSARELAQISAQAWFVVIGLSLAMALLRAARVAIVARVAQLGPVIKASFQHGAANAVLPGRLGEAVLPLALSRYSGLDPVRAVGLLLIVRLGDLIVLIGLGFVFVAAIDLWNHSAAVRSALVLGGLALIAGVSFVPAMVGQIGSWTPKTLRALAGRLARAGSALTGNTRLGLLVVTLAIWLVLGVAAHVSISASGLEIGLGYAFLAAIAASLAFALPTNGIASAGPFEAAFVGILTLSGASAELALAAAIHLHLCALIAALLAALSTLLFPAYWGDKPLCP